MAYLLEAKQVTAVSLTSLPAVKFNDVITPPLGNMSLLCEVATDGFVLKKRVYPVKLVAHSNVTVSLR